MVGRLPEGVQHLGGHGDRPSGPGHRGRCGRGAVALAGGERRRRRRRGRGGGRRPVPGDPAVRGRHPAVADLPAPFGRGVRPPGGAAARRRHRARRGGDGSRRGAVLARPVPGQVEHRPRRPDGGGGHRVGGVRGGQPVQPQPGHHRRGGGGGSHVVGALLVDWGRAGQHRVPRPVDGPDARVSRGPHTRRWAGVTDGLPPEFERILERGAFCSIAAETRRGPHLTPLVFAWSDGRVWLTTSCGSVKAWAWRAVTFTGRAAAYDVLDPSTWIRTAVRMPAVTAASVRFTAKNARFFAGYAVDARRVPLAWTPPGRVFVE